MRKLLLLAFLASPAFGAYSIYRSITIDHTKCGASDSLSFAVLVSASDTTLKTAANGGHVQNTTTQSSPAVTMPADLIFATTSGGLTKLPWEIEFYDPVNGILVAWVQLPTVSHASNTVFYMLYDDATVTTAQNTGLYTPQLVWDAYSVAVWHLTNPASPVDSTSYANNGTDSGVTTGTGQIDGAGTFNGSSYITFANTTSVGLPVAITVSAWINANAFSNDYNAVLHKGDGSNYYEFFVRGTGKVSAFVSTSGGGVNYDGTATATLATGTWYHLAWTYDSIGGLVGYVNGVLDKSVAANGTLTSSAMGGAIGEDNVTSGRIFSGLIDEVEIANAPRSADWILTEYNNQHAPGNIASPGFLTYSAEGGGGGPAHIRHRVFSLAQAAASSGGPYTVALISYVDCATTGCGGKVLNGDTSIYTAWSAAGTTTFNGAAVTGALYGTANDGNINYGGEGPNCEGFNLIWLNIVGVDMTSGHTYGGGEIDTFNCMSGYGTAPGTMTWSPAASGTCTSGFVALCNWKSAADFCVDGVCYLAVLRQDGSGGSCSFCGHDATLIKSANSGASWLNPAHVGGSPDVNGDAPAGPGDSSYPASIIWPDPSSHNGVDQKMGRLVSITYGRDGATWPAVDNNATYMYFLSYDGANVNWYLSRVVRANLPNLSKSDWSYYDCPGYSTTICDGSLSGSWNSTMANATPLGMTVVSGAVFYSAQIGTYILTGGTTSYVLFYTAPHPWGPWTLSSSQSWNPIAGAQLSFVSPMLPTLTTVSSNAIQVTYGATEYNHQGSGSPAFVTYQISH